MISSETVKTLLAVTKVLLEMLLQFVKLEDRGEHCDAALAVELRVPTGASTHPVLRDPSNPSSETTCSRSPFSSRSFTGLEVLGALLAIPSLKRSWIFWRNSGTD